MGKKAKLPKRTTPLPRTEPCPDRIVIQSHGMGVESQAILERWVAEPESRPFVNWDQLIVVTAQVGEEHKKDTIRDCENRMLPLLRQHNVRFVELARRGFYEEDGIVVLQDTRRPEKLHPEGCYSLSSYLLRCGTVPQFGGEHRCAQKYKAFVIETWLALEFQHLELTKPVYHVFGYNADEVTRTDKSEYHIRRHNAEKDIPLSRPKTPLMVFGFNSEEKTRVERSALYDGPSRVGHYPLDEWNWDRAKCIGYILQKTGIVWRKSACSFCFSGETVVATADGDFPIRDLADTTPTLLVPDVSSGERRKRIAIVEGFGFFMGVWKSAPVRWFGVQPLLKITLERVGVETVTKVLRCTPEHLWILANGTEIRAAGLMKGHCLASVVEKLPKSIFPVSEYLFEHTRAPMSWRVAEVVPDGTGDVFCATVEGAEAFMLTDDLLTGNCPFCGEASKGEPDAVRRWEESPEDTAKGMLVEYNSLCFNPRGHLYRDRALQDVVKRVGVTAAQEAFEKKLAEVQWAVYRVRRIYTKKGKAMRYVERLTLPQTRPFAEASIRGILERDCPPVEVKTMRGIEYHFFARREPDVYPTREGYFVVAPAFMEDKLRGKPAVFNERWERVGKGLPMNPVKEVSA